ncbi:hypothetical protein [Micromonospora sp. NBC_01699]|uniref:hypothetical protein n=1 Tax=Micromonospora sp. NBC_01699 TaxID=2975984 RepID=UPI002E33E271|nr:hypothetical protein [Micromonospora sp. NBC_01699]
MRADRTAATDFRSLTGRGVRATVEGHEYAVGGPALLRELDVRVPDELVATTDGWSRRGAAVLHLVRIGDGSAEALGATIVVALNAQLLRRVRLSSERQ